MNREFQFGVQVQHTGSAHELTALARRAESLGYANVVVDDHFGRNWGPLTALAAIASATSRIRLGAMVFANDFRHPVVLAKEIATLDVLSGGRVEVGMGAGWWRREYEQLDVAYDPPPTRIARLVEAVHVMNGLFADGPFSFSGDHYTVRNLDGHPKPVQRPRPPLLIGGGGRRILSAAALRADRVNINYDLRSGELPAGPARDTSYDALAEKVGWIRSAAGPRFEDVQLSIPVLNLDMTGDARRLSRELAELGALSEVEIRDSPYYLIGTTEDVVAELRRLRSDLGISCLYVPSTVMESFAPVVERLAGR